MAIVLGVAGYSGSGKTTLIEALLPCLKAQGLRVAVIKHSHHDLVLDTPGKDSDRHRRAGASQVLLLGTRRYAISAETGRELTLDEQLALLAPCDLVLLEGQKWAEVPKLEVYRAALGKPALYPTDPNVLALVSDGPQPVSLPQLDIHQPRQVAQFIYHWWQQQTKETR